ncbi:MAG TPA: hypothetical protein PKJ45_08820 [Rubrivivax sp.]|nr:hypothetical protein [Rubrivivax sp.]
MGVLTGRPITRLDAATVKRLIQALQRHGIGANASLLLAPLTTQPPQALDEATQERVVSGLRELNQALEASATPSTEWSAMRRVLGDEMLIDLLGIGDSSLRRYAAGDRQTPDSVAARLHWLAMVVADLAGAYNDFGIRRWFVRPRSQLQARSPRDVLGLNWSPDDEGANRVRALAAVLSGPQALAA